MKKEIYVLGVGLSTPVFIDLALDCGYEIAGLYHYNDDRTGELIHGYKIDGSFSDLFSNSLAGKCFLLSMGNTKIRKEISSKIIALGGVIPTLIHPTAIISRFSEISSNGVIIAPSCIIQADVQVEDGVVLRDNALVCHNTKIKQFAFVGPKTLVGANLIIGELSFLGQGSVIISSKVQSIGNEAVVGAGAVVVNPVLDKQIVVGNPAKNHGR